MKIRRSTQMYKLNRVIFGPAFESKLKAIEDKNCELYVVENKHDPLITPLIIAENIKILTKYLNNIAPLKITFNDISFRTILDDINNSTIAGFISNLRKIPNIEFEYCALSIRFFRMLFELPAEMIHVKFRGCQVIPEYKRIIVEHLVTNYKLRTLEFDDITEYRDSITLDGEIKRCLYRNRAQHVCRRAVIAIIQIRKKRNKFWDLVDKSIVINLAKSIYKTKDSMDWIKIVFQAELESLGFRPKITNI